MSLQMISSSVVLCSHKIPASVKYIFINYISKSSLSVQPVSTHLIFIITTLFLSQRTFPTMWLRWWIASVRKMILKYPEDEADSELFEKDV